MTDTLANTLYYGDNLPILRSFIKDSSVDLIYLDPPFNSNATYNVLFKSPAGQDCTAQIEAFDDSWHWNSASELAFDDVLKSGNSDAAHVLAAFLTFLQRNDLMAYLVMMAVRLIELHRVLKPTGSIYLHCDPTASHYLKILMDAIFGKENYRNEITWQRTSAHSDGARWGKNTDIILFYTKSDTWTWNKTYLDYDDKYLGRFRFSDPDGRKWMDDNATAKGLSGGGYQYDYKGAVSLWRYPLETMQRLDSEKRLHFTKTGGIRLKRYLDEAKGSLPQALWTDIPPINSQAAERMGYPTQKPIALLERILKASTKPGDIVLDPFCGCGTSVYAAQLRDLHWIVIDITHLAVGLIRRRLIDAFPQAQFEVRGVPRDVGGGRELAAADKHEFQLFTLSMIEAQPYKGGRKGADGGVDGYLYFKPDGTRVEKAVVSVKGGGNVGVGMIRDLIATIDREKARVGIFLTLEDPTTNMRREAAAAGFYDSPLHGKFEKIQILTLTDLFDGKRPHLPWIDSSVFRKASRAPVAGQENLDI